MRAFPLTAETLPGLASRKTVIWSAIVCTELCLLLHRAHKYPGFEPRSVLHHGERTSSEGSRRRSGAAWPFWRLGSLAHCCCSTLADGGWNSARLGWLLLGYLAWCGLSILWSENLPLTIRHFSVLLFCRPRRAGDRAS